MEFYSNPKEVVFTTPLPQLDRFNIPKTAKILEIGCGYGRVLQHLYECGYCNLAGVDCSAELISRAQMNGVKAELIVGDIVEISLNKKYDVIIMCGVLEYIIGKERRKKLVKKICNLLNENGVFYLEGFLRDEFDDIYMRSQDENLSYGTIILDNGLTLFHASEKELKDMFFENGLTPIMSKTTEFLTWSEEYVPGLILLCRKDLL